jgi:hypothetical protein
MKSSQISFEQGGFPESANDCRQDREARGVSIVADPVQQESQLKNGGVPIQKGLKHDKASYAPLWDRCAIALAARYASATSRRAY